MKKLIYLIGICTAIFLLSCNPKYYSPNTQNVPLITQQGETCLNVSGSGNQLEFQGAYGINDKFAIKLNGGLFIPKDLDNGNGGSGNFIEGGFGYFKPFSNNLVFETYGIVGLGSMENHLPGSSTTTPPTEGDISANIYRFGLQPNFGYKTTYFEAAVSSRIVSLNYSGVEGDLIFDSVDQVKYLEDNNSKFLIEPAITLRGGIEKIKFQLQLGYSLNVSDSDFKQDKSFGTIGLSFRFK